MTNLSSFLCSLLTSRKKWHRGRTAFTVKALKINLCVYVRIWGGVHIKQKKKTGKYGEWLDSISVLCLDLGRSSTKALEQSLKEAGLDICPSWGVNWKASVGQWVRGDGGGVTVRWNLPEHIGDATLPVGGWLLHHLGQIQPGRGLLLPCCLLGHGHVLAAPWRRWSEAQLEGPTGSSTTLLSRNSLSHCLYWGSEAFLNKKQRRGKLTQSSTAQVLRGAQGSPNGWWRCTPT